MPEKQKKTIRELTLMLMYLTSWEERDTPEMRAVKKKEDTHRMAEANKAFAHYRF